ncbi:MAG: DUF1761 domain-containing protein [Gammaproteobacteria bacterium]|nr:DUF1761 domain-containing protein [Gammaproteobacteria bacterium]
MNYWAILVAAVGSFALGGLWYSQALFGKAWARDAGVGAQSGHQGRIFAVSFVWALVAAVAFAWVLGPEATLSRGLRLGAIVGIAFVAASFGINYQFSRRTLTLWAIDGGYHTAQFLLYGAILGLWH